MDNRWSWYEPKPFRPFTDLEIPCGIIDNSDADVRQERSSSIVSLNTDQKETQSKHKHNRYSMLKHFNQSKCFFPLDQVLQASSYNHDNDCGNMEVVQLWSQGTLNIIKSLLFNLNCDDNASHAKECLIAWGKDGTMHCIIGFYSWWWLFGWACGVLSTW